MAEALTINTTVTTIKYVPALWRGSIRRLTAPRFVTDGGNTIATIPRPPYSLSGDPFDSDGAIGPEGGIAIAEALKVNHTLTAIK